MALLKAAFSVLIAAAGVLAGASTPFQEVTA